jgi:magnesium transporter
MQGNTNSSEVTRASLVLAAELANEHVADVAEFLNEQSADIASNVLTRLPLDRAVEVLDQSELVTSPNLLAALPDDKATMFLPRMSADRVADVFHALEEPRRAALLDRLDDETRLSVLRLLSYPPDTAGSIMTTEFVSVPVTWTVAQTLDHIRRVEPTRETVYPIYVVDPETKKLVQTISLRRLISGKPQSPVPSITRYRQPVVVTPLTDREEVARTISKYDLLAVPVVDRGMLSGS